LDVKLVAIASDTPRELKKMSEKYDMVYIADLDTKEIIRAYDAEKFDSTKKPEKNLKIKDCLPITYLLNSESTILWKFVGTKEKRPPNKKIFAAIKKFL
jgi:peroxiredoxin